MSRLSLFLLLFPTLLSPAAALAADPQTNTDAAVVATAQGMIKDLRTLTLPNGLRVYLLPVEGAPVVSVMVAYKVGSADEEKDQTGLSHYLEHLMFKGTEKLVPGDIDRATQRNGGRNNAYTSEDMTVYHFDFAADRWQIALDIEADRMRNIRIDERHEFEQEKGAVIAELEGNEDSPWNLEFKTILPLLFPADSPYSHPVIGQRGHVRGATAEIIKRHYDAWYHPSNAALVIVGGFDPEVATTKIKQLFGPIPRGELPPRKKPTFHTDRSGPLRKEFESKFDVPRLLVGFNTVGVGTPDDPVLDFVQMILGDGKTSRLYQKLVEDELLASDVGAGNYAGRFPGWFAVNVELLSGKDRQKAEELVLAELEKLANEPVSDEELSRARRKLLASFVFSRESVHDLADAIARVSTYPGGEDVGKFFRHYLTQVLAVTKEDIQRASKEHLARQKAVLVWSVPKPASPGPKTGQSAPRPLSPGLQAGPALLARSPHSAFRGARVAQQAAGSGEFSLTAAKRVVLPNGLKLIMLEDHRLPIVVARAAVTDVSLREPAEKSGIATLVGDLLAEGTDKHTGREISALIEATGGSFSMTSSGGSVKVLTPDTDLALGLLFECLLRPAFPADALARQRDQQLSAIDDALAQPRTRGSLLFNATVYGSHPSGRSPLGKKEIVAQLTAEDCQAFHKAAFAPDFTIVVVVGDFQADEMAQKVLALTKDWPKSGAAKPQPPAPPKPEAAVNIVSDATAAQVHVFLGHLGIIRRDPDYYKLLVLDNVLGTGPGFTDRLSASLRDRQGLAYTVSATITTSAGTQPGTFLGYIGTFPDKFLTVRYGFVKEVLRIRETPPSAEEVEDAKKYLLGSLPFRFTTLTSVAGQLLEAERYGLGFDFLETYRKEVESVTPADVQRVARQHLDPDALAIIAVGQIDEKGQPLADKKDP